VPSPVPEPDPLPEPEPPLDLVFGLLLGLLFNLSSIPCIKSAICLSGLKLSPNPADLSCFFLSKTFFHLFLASVARSMNFFFFSGSFSFLAFLSFSSISFCSFLSSCSNFFNSLASLY